MSFYLIPPSQNFLSTLAEFILKKYKDSLSELKVILPTGYNCFCLQKALTQKQKYTILPNIVPLADLITESEEFFKIPSENIGTLTPLEEKLLLAEIIYNNSSLNLSLNQALKFSPKLAKLFYDIEVSELGIESLSTIQSLNQAEHWQAIHNFLIEAHESWQKKISESCKISKAAYQTQMLLSEIERLKKNHNSPFRKLACEDEELIIAGIYGHNQTVLNFMKSAYALPNCHIIGDFPLEAFTLKDKNISFENGLYLPINLIKTLGLTTDKINIIDSDGLCSSKTMMPDPLFNFLSGTFSKKDTTSLNTIEYQEFTNIFEEAEYIASYCYKFLQKSPYSKIAIVLPKLKSKNIYSNFLYNYEELKVNDLLGNSILKFQATKLILDVARLLYTTENLDLKKLFILLKNPLLNSPEVIKLERLLSGKNRFVQSWSDIEQILEEDNEPALKDLVSRLSQIFNSKNPPSSSFNKLLITTVKTVEKLFPQIWESEKAQEISNFLSELFELKCETMLEQVFHFPELLETILSSGRVFEQNRKDDNNVYLCNISDVTLQSFDLVIIPGFDSDSWPPADIVSPWLSNQMQLDLNLMLDKIALGQNHYYFYELLHNPNILITRAKKQDSKKESLPSNYMLQLELLMSESIIYQKECVNETQKPNHRNLNDTQQKNREIYPIHFPNRLSATDIETLIRNPYSFYAKKILRLKKHIGIAAAPMLSEFGSFLHSIIEKYTKTYSSDTKDRSDYFINLGIQDLNTILLPEATQKIWGIKLSQIAKPFITWDEERRINSSKILTEIKGSVEIELSNRTVTITAIADRIEIDRHGHITLLDFKTGAVPSKNDVFSGLSPQLIVEAIIAKANGFDIGQGELNRLVYVKISSSKPYIQTTEIDISQNELENHKAALIALLNFYATTQNYNHDLDLLKYNDYKHLARI